MGNNTKRILIITSNTYPYKGGDGNNALNFSISLRKYGYIPILLALNRNVHLPSQTYLQDVRIVRIPYFNFNILAKLLSRIITFFYFFIYIRKSNYILIYGKFQFFEAAILLGTLLKKKVIFRSTMLGFDDTSSLLKKKGLTTKIRKILLGKISYYYSLSSAFTKEFNLNFSQSNKIFESCQGVNTKEFHSIDKTSRFELRKKLKVPKDIFVFLSIGFLVKRKGFGEIFQVLREINYPFLYIVIGDFEPNKSNYSKRLEVEMHELYHLGNKLLGDKIKFTGRIDNVADFLRITDIVIINSYREGISNVLLEAMACGAPVIVRELPGLRDYIINDENTLPINNHNELKERILMAFDDQQVRRKIGMNAEKTILQKFTLDSITNRFISYCLK